jgi:hypothetical protein
MNKTNVISITQLVKNWNNIYGFEQAKIYSMIYQTVILNTTKLFSIMTNNSILTVNFVLIDCVVSRNNDVTVRPTKTRIVLM